MQRALATDRLTEGLFDRNIDIYNFYLFDILEFTNSLISDVL